jgi:hypothetical protein
MTSAASSDASRRAPVLGPPTAPRVLVSLDTLSAVTTREKIDRLLDQLSEAELQSEYQHLLPSVDKPDVATLPEGWGQTRTGEPMPNVVAALHRSRASH